MAPFTPYTYIQCPCYDAVSHSRSGEDAPSSNSQGANDDEEHTFDPRAPRSNYSLYPLEYLLYCDVCHQIRCPRCVSEELVTIYCPSCLFEVGSSSLKTEGNRCTRSCFQCPICIGPLAVQSLESAPEPSLLSAENPSAVPSGPWVLTCSYCHWNSTEIGVKFDKPQGIFAQLQKLRYGEEQPKHAALSSRGDASTESDVVPETTKAKFSALKAFYNAQNAAANPSTGISGLGDYGLNSPGALSRIMSIYSGNNLGGLKQKNKATMMREAEAPNEGFRPSDLDESAALAKLRREGYDGTVTSEQAATQVEEGARFSDELWPIPYLLRTKRSKRCPVCRHIISKPESKVGNTRWRIRLVAHNAIPSITVKPLNPTPGRPGSSASTTGPNNAPVAVVNPAQLRPLLPVQYVLTFKNPLFDDVKVTLAAPATTPGRFASRVTVLCPEFQIDANTDTDMYLDDVLKDGGRAQDVGGGSAHTTHQAEAGKIWERGRNWVSIVVEVIPASLTQEANGRPLQQDEDVLEIPMFVRLEWESDVTGDQVGPSSTKEKEGREKRELAYWCAIGVGRITE
ncbi:dynactin p62 family protein [Xylariomycetidae sp. FL0641]|nr:dynactin p62 family protein [Xylariomycetidae sp. FL0641]